MDLLTKIEETKQFILSKTDYTPEIAIILGSGLGELANEIENPVTIPYHEIPHFATTSVDLHKGQLVIGELENKVVVVMQGRFHYYEGLSMAQITYPVHVFKALGVENLFVTNASGGINREFVPADIMLITDHLNLAGANPLIGPNDERIGVRFPDLSQAYTPALQTLALKVAEQEGIDLKQGVYAWLSGPSIETPAEIRMLDTLGADAVGMSSVPEVIVANYIGLNVLAVANISNLAAGITTEPITIEEVVEYVGQAKDKTLALVKGVLKEMV